MDPQYDGPCYPRPCTVEEFLEAEMAAPVVSASEVRIRLQGPEALAALESAFNASVDELGEAAVALASNAEARRHY